MRRVRVFKGVKYSKLERGEFSHVGWFHGFHLYGNPGDSVYPIAIIEDDEGDLLPIPINLVNFIYKPTTKERG